MHRTCAHLAFLLAALVCAPAGAQAQEAPPDTLRLSEVLSVVVQSSPALATAQMNQRIADAQVIQALGISDILLQASTGYTYQSDQAVDPFFSGSNTTGRLSAQVTLSKLLSTGGTVALHANSSRTDRSQFFMGTVGEAESYVTQFSARINQPLLRGFGNEVTLATQQQARKNRSAVALDLEVAARNEIRSIIEAYWEVVWAHKDLEIRKSALELAVERRRLTDSSVKLGSAPRTALLEVDQIMATNEEEILLAEQRITEQSLELRRLAGLEIGPGHLSFRTEEQLSVSPKTFDVDTELETAFENSPELAALAIRGENATIEVAVAENSTRSKLDLGLFVGPQGTDESIGSALGRTVSLKGYYVGADLTFEKTLGNHAAGGGRAEARARRQLIRVNERQLRAQIAVQVSRAVQSANIANKRMKLSQRAIELSELNIEAERRRFESGKATNFDVLQRQEEQKQARLRYARAEVDYLRATVALQALRGELLSGYGITL